MRIARFWTGVAILMGMAMAISLAASPARTKSPGTIEGIVTYCRRPVHGGTIYFVEGDRTIDDVIAAGIDETGHYQAEATLRRDRSGGKCYRIHVVLNPREYPVPDSVAADADASDDMVGDELTASRSPEWSPPTGRVVLASSGPVHRAPESRRAARMPQHRFSDPRTTNLSVRLDNRPTRVDVDLSD